MLNTGLKKKVFLIISSLFIILIIYLFPEKKETITIKENKEKQDVIYLIDNNNYVSRVTIILNEKETIKKVKEIINYLTIDSSKAHYIKEGFKQIIPKNTKVLSLSIDKDLLKINFSNHFLNIREEDEEKMISSLIYSLTTIKGINKISIYVNGNILNMLPNSKKLLDAVLDRTYGINKIYDLTNIKGSAKTTIYYLSKYKDYYYYVPVSIINNNKKDKIEIIIEELSSKSVYQTGLISYLKDDQKMSYEITNDAIFLKMNNILFNSLNDNNLLEKVIYTINLSIKDNYDIKKVIYYVDNNIYKKYSL